MQFSMLTLDKKIELKPLGRPTPEYLIEKIETKKIKTVCLRGS
jgi:hypothetical protein